MSMPTLCFREKVEKALRSSGSNGVNLGGSALCGTAQSIELRFVSENVMIVLGEAMGFVSHVLQ